MIRSDRGVCGVIDLNDLLDATEGRYGEGSPLAQLDLVALRLLRPMAATHTVRASQRLAAGPTAQGDRRPDPRRDSRRLCPGNRTSNRPGWQTAQREADLQRLVDELAAELQRLDEDLELLLTAVAAG